MSHYEYKVIPAPQRAEKAKGVRTSEGRFAHTIEAALNQLGADGWEYLRAELLPQEERSGLKAAKTQWRTVLVFRRLTGSVAEGMQARVLDTPAPDPIPTALPPVVAAPAAMAETPQEPPVTAPEAEDDSHDSTVIPLTPPENEGPESR